MSLAHSYSRAARAACVLACLAGGAQALYAQTAPAPVTPGPGADAGPYEGMLVGEIRFEGLERTSPQLASNTVRTATGRPLRWETVQDDIRRLVRLGRFNSVTAELEVLSPESIGVVYVFEEALIIAAIDVVGNVSVSNQEIATIVNERVSLIEGTDLDEFRINKARQAIIELYRTKGFFQAEVAVDQEELDRDGTVLFRVREGQQTEVTGIRFSGNEAFSSKQLRPEVNSKTKILFFDAPLDTEQLDRDVAALVRFYRGRGYLDVRADREITPSPNGREAIITFLIDEGQQYTLRNVFVETAPNADGDQAPLRVMSPEQVRGLIGIKPGAPLSSTAVSEATTTIRDAYHQMGYVDARVGRQELRVIESNEVDLRIIISEGERWKTGLVSIAGNELTRQKVIRRRVEVAPDRWLDGKAIDRSELRLEQSRLFETNPAFGNPPSITILPPDPANPGYRDVLVEVQETNTGSFSFGAAVDSDAGVVGAISLNQRNFDIADTPDSFDEFIRGRAFRGAGQTFDITLQPGSEISTYSISLTEPAIFGTDYSLSGSAFYRDREFRQYDEQRFGGRARLARRFGTRWIGSLALRAESIELSDIDNDAPVDVFEVEDQNLLTSVGFGLTRTTVDNRFRPTKGTRTELGLERVGAFGGDYDFTKLSAEHTLFLTVDRDEFGRESIVSIRTQAGYIPEENEAPVYERFYLGGRSFRGFEFRGIGPVGVRNDTGQPGDDQVGGDFLFFLGAEYEKPVWQDIMSVVFFVDSGTINDDFGLDNYRVSVGTGVRLYLPQFGQAPLAFDFAIPIKDESTDESQLFSFSIDLPF